MFASTVIRKLARSEEMFAETHNFVGLGAELEGDVDISAMAAAFDSLLEAQPLLGGHIERGSDGRHQFVADDLIHTGLEVVKLDAAFVEPPVRLDQSESLARLRLIAHDGGAQLTLYIHHSLADGHHQFSLVEELFTYYTALVCTGHVGPVTVRSAPEPLEIALAERHIAKQRRSGLERFMPAMFVYDLPPSRRAATTSKPPLPLQVPVARRRLSAAHTHALIAFCRANRLRANAVLSAAILLAEWQLRDTPNIPIPYIYPVDLRYILSPPLSATACTNPLGVATYLAEINDDTDIVDLARDIAETFQRDVSEGVIQQSLLHFSPQYVGNAPGLPDVVMLTDTGPVPAVRTPPGLKLTACQSTMFFAVDAGIDIYFSGIFADQMWIEHHSHAPALQKSVEAIHSLLCATAEQHVARGAG
ncbi:acyltransferase [Mycolicibacterium agri]|uniref:Phthiocerol/phthiodiolone dimycocerosyl transferase n=1 Tax=Mycolicibacterium agri TaxID=36811 RepID=A0A2A7MS36_MYCAG|nr:acyltransferase [Mycolicibacterium agri]PEG34516.1 acyltransferase [Mycolicibacterium agri]GFG54681.1 phthiocerol/phthiodiolone dimycocerosyl transferase [Mycolicibacterium agri]